MKKYRCPHCGEKSFSISDRLYMGYVRLGVLRITSGNTLDGCLCAKCQRIVMPPLDGLFLRILFSPIRATYRVPALPILTIGLYFVGVLHWIFIPISVLHYLAFLVYLVVYSLTKPLVPYNNELVRHDRHIALRAETRVSVNSSKYINPYGVYGLKFKTETASEKLKEAFSDGMVPAVFHPNEKGSLTYDVRIINRLAVPDEILFDGAKFLVEDCDGIFIAKGTVEKAELDH